MFEKIKSIILEQLSVLDSSEITADTTFDSMDIDSIDAVEIIMAIEDEFEIEIPDEIAEKFTSISDVITYLASVGIE
ncbi:acyl carrier protein [Fusibacter tunisiensis]|uniref:Acyl carrier protein n=1 Tax=Fusibacter tunisiensis TaxID=1008308 RepID=A0ABS2MPL1_9FIRM|nr:acyl carrier protein [Fusibacter tunisiensis]MBM7561352.1 acyl carrier protein [Fusibacter tunisiensis]